ncbi:Uncharacterised protein [Vibrio cholerae]|nr:Uncharacterised protein [Vibrio cholerae]CSC53709.1 Uncharacterised protein [Vibrio cholerae]CSI37424.1 Uncharacterised protein [Vibrio cholerae]CSI52682.1 Uncharacterised protein [Vibrio cholerae]
MPANSVTTAAEAIQIHNGLTPNALPASCPSTTVSNPRASKIAAINPSSTNTLVGSKTSYPLPCKEPIDQCRNWLNTSWALLSIIK